MPIMRCIKKKETRRKFFKMLPSSVRGAFFLQKKKLQGIIIIGVI
jgi:hypothetical protein